MTSSDGSATPQISMEYSCSIKVEHLDFNDEPDFKQECEEENEETKTASLPNFSTFLDPVKLESPALSDDSFISVESPPPCQPDGVYDLCGTNDADGIPHDIISQEFILSDNLLLSSVIHNSNVVAEDLYTDEAQREMEQGSSRMVGAAGQGIQSNNQQPEASINEDNTKETGQSKWHVSRRRLLKTRARKRIYQINDDVDPIKNKVVRKDVPRGSPGLSHRPLEEISVNKQLVTSRVIINKRPVNVKILKSERPKKITRIISRYVLRREVIQQNQKGNSLTNAPRKLRSAKNALKRRVLVSKGAFKDFLNKHKNSPNCLTESSEPKKKRHEVIPKRPPEIISTNDEDLNNSIESRRDIVTKQVEIKNINAIDLTNSEERQDERHADQLEGDSESNEECHNPFISFDENFTSTLELENQISYRLYTFQRREEFFKLGRTGCIISYPSGYHAFRSFWDDSVIQLVVDKINKEASDIPSPNFPSKWYPTNIHEVLCLFACWILMGVIKMPTTESCFTYHPLLNTDAFRRIFTFQRYSDLIKVLNYHFTNPGNFNYIPLSKRIFSNLNASFKANYIPSRNLFIEEDLACKIMHHEECKPWYNEIRAMRMFALRERATGYLWSFVLCAESLETLDPAKELALNKSTAIVKQLMDPIFNKGFKLYTDNWSNAVILANLLKRNGTDYAGTLPLYSNCIPSYINAAARKGARLKIWESEDFYMSTWRDSSLITMVTTYTGIDVAVYNQLPKSFNSAPELVRDFKEWKNVRDNEYVDSYMLDRTRTYKWFLKNFKRLLHCSVANAHILFNSTTRPVDFLDFRLNLVDAILAHHQLHMAQGISQSPGLNTSSSSQHPAQCIRGFHRPTYVKDIVDDTGK